MDDARICFRKLLEKHYDKAPWAKWLYRRLEGIVEEEDQDIEGKVWTPFVGLRDSPGDGVAAVEVDLLPVVELELAKLDHQSIFVRHSRQFMKAVLEAEGRAYPDAGPNETLSSWMERPDIPSHYPRLMDYFGSAFRGVRQMLENDQRDVEFAARMEEAKVRAQEELEALKARHEPLVTRFCEIVDRKVSVVDEYGDKNWSAVGPELSRFMEKVVERDELGKEARADVLACVGKAMESGYSKTPAGIRFGATVAEAPESRLYEAFAAHALERLLDRHEATQLSGTRTATAQMSGVEFEGFVARLLARLGYSDVRGTPSTGDQGADLIATHDGQTIVIQAKRYQGAVGNKAVQEVIAAKAYYGGHEAWVVTNSAFTSSARALADAANVRLIDGDELDSWVSAPENG